MKNRGRWFFFMGGNRDGLSVYSLLLISLFFAVVSPARAELGPENLLILVNADSATSQYIAKMYCEYYPAINAKQVLELSGLPDCSGPGSTAADEIITRDVYNTCIAGPVRQHLVDNNLLDQIMVIVTTAGMPYRIEDTTFPNVVYPAGSDYNVVGDYEHLVDAASVESELTCLWYSDTGGNPAGLQNRIVNPYQGCVSPFDLFGREIVDSNDLTWSYGWSKKSGVSDPLMEGESYGYGTINRIFGPGQMYLTCRLDGPKNQGKSAIFAVRNMLERSNRASSGSGVNPNQAVIVLDDAPASPLGNVDNNRVFNLHDDSVDFWSYSGAAFPVPESYLNRVSDDYIEAFYNLLAGNSMQNIGDLYFGTSEAIHGIPALEDYRNYTCTAAYGLDFLLDYYPDRQVSQGVVALCCYGKNGDEGRGSDYLLSGGPGGQAMYALVNGAVFTSLESFNAVTMFSDVQTAPSQQGKVIDFISIGGSGAIGHAFEPQADAVIDNEFFVFNLMADETGPQGVPDDLADLTFVEAVWTGIPYLSWAEVVIGDPLMRIAYGPGEDQAWTPFAGDSNGDDKVNYIDVIKVRIADGTSLYSEDETKKSKYKDLCDINQDGKINYIDVIRVRMADGTSR